MVFFQGKCWKNTVIWKYELHLYGTFSVWDYPIPTDANIWGTLLLIVEWFYQERVVTEVSRYLFSFVNFFSRHKVVQSSSYDTV